jgi:hypothetical protein
MAQQRLGADFDIRGFHGAVLGNGAVPLDVLEQIVLQWIDSSTSPDAAVAVGVPSQRKE